MFRFLSKKARRREAERKAAEKAVERDKAMKTIQVATNQAKGLKALLDANGIVLSVELGKHHE